MADLEAAVGQAVKKGDVLATADESDARATQETAKAALQSAQQKLADDQAKPTADDRATAKNSLDQATQSLADEQQNQSDTKKQNELSLSDSRAAYQKARRLAFRESISRLQEASGAAVATVLRIMLDSKVSAGTRLRAAEVVLSQGARAMEMEDIVARLAELERVHGSRKLAGVIRLVERRGSSGPPATHTQLFPLPPLAVSSQEE